MPFALLLGLAAIAGATLLTYLYDRDAPLWPRLCAMYPDYADYQARTSRDIPVLRLARS